MWLNASRDQLYHQRRVGPGEVAGGIVGENNLASVAHLEHLDDCVDALGHLKEESIPKRSMPMKEPRSQIFLSSWCRSCRRVAMTTRLRYDASPFEDVLCLRPTSLAACV